MHGPRDRAMVKGHGRDNQPHRENELRTRVSPSGTSTANEVDSGRHQGGNDGTPQACGEDGGSAAFSFDQAAAGAP
ncbi:hypothetical protein E2562_032540 [Oryza meyeriana var. granulata]|uniref:Uncharacterized protein n=1 Tax=Oryza meyeriana var. granulata TaxID=110450 RepID=A0A6G1CUL6_9ORYZ|nr:hypothetical protein E2562_032540 [Oryza meyeriana var. granulata]